ncbi:MAG: metallophosphoesterase family protein [Gammaproteobacteria bacterium]|nr:metallophosphoesterase family protein [Gammaproteobacteria bacterium]MBL6998690.1 metallophosphoesterase family protein [Gammaproteobacteria bacterium]
MHKPVTVAIISDTHASLHEEIKAIIRQCDIAIHAGDICDADILDAMQPKTGQVIAVTGNNDHERGWPAHQAQRVKQLPAVAALDLPGGVVKIEHGHVHDMNRPDHQDLRDAHPEARLVVYGHTHRKVIDDYAQPWVVNPGAAGATRTRGGPSCLVLTASETLWKIDSYRFADKLDQATSTAASVA